MKPGERAKGMSPAALGTLEALTEAQETVRRYRDTLEYVLDGLKIVQPSLKAMKLPKAEDRVKEMIKSVKKELGK